MLIMLKGKGKRLGGERCLKGFLQAFKCGYVGTGLIAGLGYAHARTIPALLLRENPE